MVIKGKFKKLLLGTSVVIGATAIGTTPASAQGFSTSGVNITYCSDGINTFFDGQVEMSCTDSLGTILSGNSSAPGGNVELGGDTTDFASLTEFQGLGASTLTADFGNNHIISFSSLTYSDWFGTNTPTDFSADNLATQWFKDGLATYGQTIRDRAAMVNPDLDTDEEIFAAFVTLGGFQNLSDPNVAYVNKSGDLVTFGLASRQDASAISPLFEGIFTSEVVKVTKDGKSEFFYSFLPPTDSGQVNKDGVSHNANYEFSLVWKDNEKVPEPSAIMGLLALGSLFVAKGKGKQS